MSQLPISKRPMVKAKTSKTELDISSFGSACLPLKSGSPIVEHHKRNSLSSCNCVGILRNQQVPNKPTASPSRPFIMWQSEQEGSYFTSQDPFCCYFLFSIWMGYWLYLSMKLVLIEVLSTWDLDIMPSLCQRNLQPIFQLPSPKSPVHPRGPSPMATSVMGRFYGSIQRCSQEMKLKMVEDGWRRLKCNHLRYGKWSNSWSNSSLYPSIQFYPYL